MIFLSCTLYGVHTQRFHQRHGGQRVIARSVERCLHGGRHPRSDVCVWRVPMCVPDVHFESTCAPRRTKMMRKKCRLHFVSSTHETATGLEELGSQERQVLCRSSSDRGRVFGAQETDGEARTRSPRGISEAKIVQKIKRFFFSCGKVSYNSIVSS